MLQLVHTPIKSVEFVGFSLPLSSLPLPCPAPHPYNLALKELGRLSCKVFHILDFADRIPIVQAYLQFQFDQTDNF